MKNIYHRLLSELEADRKVCLSTLIATRGSVPQVTGASALFSESGLLAGTLGGGILEGDADLKARKALTTAGTTVYEFDLNEDIEAEEGAICGGSATVLLDPTPYLHQEIFSDMARSLHNGSSGILATMMRGREKVEISRYWFEDADPGEMLKDWEGLSSKMASCLEKNLSLQIEGLDNSNIFLEPVLPLPKIYIAGAGHIGRALAHQANLLDFEVILIDDRAEYANQENIPDADRIIVENIGKAIKDIPKTADSYLVIVTRGHKDDADALRACIGSGLPYIGMIGSRKKIRLMREKFIAKGWCTPEQFDSVHAPIGLEIGSTTVEEIAISITAQLVQVRAKTRTGKKRHVISTIILAAGESSRMGKPKMLLPYGKASIIETVIGNANRSSADKTFVVLGAGHDTIADKIQDLPVESVINPDYKQGMLSSVQWGLKAVSDSTTAVMVLLGDQPMIGDGVMDELIERYKQSDKGIVVASFQGKRGHPIVFNARYIKEILEYPPESSLKNILANHPENIEELETENQGILRDIDTQEDYHNEIKQQQI